MCVLIEDDQEVEVRQSSFLEFNNVDVCNNMSEYMFLIDVVDKFLLFLI